MAIIARDLMVGNPRLAELGYGEEALGHNAIVAGFQGQRQWTDHFPNGDFMEAILNSSFDWNGIREPFVFATENDSLNGATMLFGHLLTDTAQIFADVRTYWSPAAVKRVTGHKLTGKASGGILHLINSGAATLDATGQMTKDGKSAMKPFWEITPEDVEACLEATQWAPAIAGILPRRRLFLAIPHLLRIAGHHGAPQLDHGPGSGAATRRRLHRGSAAGSQQSPG